jgi:hypothetical protein
MNDQKTVRLVIVLLGISAAIAIVGAVGLELTGHDAAQAWTLAGTAVGGLGALLASTKATPESTTITTDPPAAATDGPADPPGVAFSTGRAPGFFGGGD